MTSSSSSSLLLLLSQDTLLYKKVVESFCDDLHKYDLWQYPIVKKYWKEKTTLVVQQCIT
jgi:hypothetical protein